MSFNAIIDGKLLKLFRKKLLNKIEFKELCKLSSITFFTPNEILKENEFIKSWGIFTFVDNFLIDYSQCFDIVNFNIVDKEKLIIFLHKLVAFRQTLINKGFHNLNLLLEDGYIIPIINVLREQNMSIDIIVDKLEKIGSTKLGYYPNEMKLFGEELYFDRVIRQNICIPENHEIIKSMIPKFNLCLVCNNLKSQKIGDANLKTILFNLGQIDIEIFDNLDRNSIVLFSLIRSSSLEIEGYLKQLIPDEGMHKQLESLLNGSYIKQFKCIRNNQKNDEILNNVSYLLNLKSTMNQFFYYVCFYYFSRNYLAHNHFMTQGNFNKMFENNYELVTELYNSIVIIALTIQWKLIERNEGQN